MHVCMASQLCKQCVQLGHPQDNQAYIDIIWDLMVLPLSLSLPFSLSPFLSLSLTAVFVIRRECKLVLNIICCTF